MSVDDVMDILAIPLMGTIPDDEAIVISTNQGEPLAGTNTLSGQAYLDISRRIMGEEIPMYAPRQNRTFFARLSGLLKRA